MPARCRTQQWAGETFRHRWDAGIGVPAGLGGLPWCLF
jgi:hypothetical protein